MTLLEVAQLCASLRRAFRADCIRVRSEGYVTVDVLSGGGLIFSATAMTTRDAFRELFEVAPS